MDTTDSLLFLDGQLGFGTMCTSPTHYCNRSNNSGNKEELIDEWHQLYPNDTSVQAGDLTALLTLERELHTRALLGLFSGTLPHLTLYHYISNTLSRSLHVPPSKHARHRRHPRNHKRRNKSLVPLPNVGRNSSHRIRLPDNLAPPHNQRR
jgi:hypothetical protein